MEHSAEDEPSTWGQPETAKALARGLLGRCPVCGVGGLFPGWIRMRDQCPQCHFWFERVEGHWIGAIGMNTILTFGTLLIVSVVGVIATFPDLAVGPLVASSVVIGLFMPIAMFPTSRTLWSAIDLVMTPLTPGDFRASGGAGDP